MSRLIVSSALTMLLCIASCDKTKREAPGPEVLTKAQFLGRLVVPERYWRIEEISRERESQISLLNVRESSPLLNSHHLNEVIPHFTMQFARGSYGKGMVTEAWMEGAYGKIPFGEFKCVLLPKSVEESGEWTWDPERKMLKLALPESVRSIAAALSGSDWVPDTGYVSSEPAPLFRGVEEARRAASPERIKLLIEEQTQTGIVNYVFTLRAAWLTDVDYRDADHKYGVSLY